MRNIIAMLLLFSIFAAPAFAQKMTEQQQQEMEQLQKMQEMQQKSLESMTKSLPTMSSFMNSMMGAATKLEEMKKERSDIVHTKTAELEAKIEEVFALVDEGKKSHAKLKALLIKVAVGLFPRFIVVFLVVDFRLPECIYLFKFGDNRIALFLQQLDQFLDCFLLVFVSVVDG